MVVKLGHTDINNLCRSCLGTEEIMRNVFEHKEYFENNALQLAEMFMSCASVQISTTDGLPFLMCSTCVEKLKVSYDFKQLIRKTDLYLRNLLNKSISAAYTIEKDSLSKFSNNRVEDVDDNQASGASIQEKIDCPKSSNPKKKVLNTRRKLSKIKVNSTGKKSSKESIDQIKSGTVKKFKCPHCDFSGLEKTLKIHIAVVHSELKRFKCHLCQFSCPLKGNLKKHIEVVHLKIKKFKCHKCDYTTARTNDLKKHVDVMHLKLKTFKCALCSYRSGTKSNLKVHIDVKHSKFNKYECHLCTYSSSNKGNLKIHIDGVHLKLKRWKCDLCDFSTIFKSSLRIHVDAVHRKLKRFKCKLCSYGSSRNTELKRHVQTIH